jgi:lipopolysaccharide/colanic/teichoic acid biosynthesis glycosyltransferase
MKRLVDVVGAVVLLVVAAPILVLVGVAVVATMGWPVLFRHERAGRHGARFELLKIRTMRAGDGSDAARLTPLGRALRATSLDELPQLWNVLRGDMSLVGPRPLPPAYLPRYSAEQARRHEVRPGITGLAQVSGRNALSWEEKFRLDVEYVERRSFALDCWILWRTLVCVCSRAGVAAPGHVTMPEFFGSTGESR